MLLKPVQFVIIVLFLSVVFSTVNKLKSIQHELLASYNLFICSSLPFTLDVGELSVRISSTKKASGHSPESDTSIPVNPIGYPGNTVSIANPVESVNKRNQEPANPILGNTTRRESILLPVANNQTIQTATQYPVNATSLSSASQQPVKINDNDFNCLEFLSPVYCQEKDPRNKFVFKYRFNKSKKRYLIVVNHHWSFYSSVSFINHKLYKRFNELYPFDFDLINMGPKFNDTLRVVNHSLRIGGEYSYYTLAKAYAFLKGYTEYDGYFLINDDAFLDPHRLREYDLRQSWHEPTRPYNWTFPWSWNYLRNEHFVPYPVAFRNAIREVTSVPSLESQCHLVLDVNQRRSLQDFFYVTASDMPVFLRLVDIFYKHRVFLEQAAATINWCLSHNEIVSCNHHNWPFVSKCVHLHPIKLGNSFNRNLAMQHIEGTNTRLVPPMSWYSVCHKH